MFMKNSQTFKLAAQYGALLGGIFIAIGLLVYTFEIDMFDWVVSILMMLSNIVLIVVLMMQAAKAIRDKIYEGTIPFLDTFLSMMLVGVIAMLMSTVFNYLLNGIFDPEFQQKGISQMEQKMLDQGLSADMVKQIMADMRSRMVPETQLITGIVSAFIMSGVIAALSALVFRKKPKVEDLIK